MKYTAERVLTWIGVGITALTCLGSLFGTILLVIMSNQTKETLIDSGDFSHSESVNFVNTWGAISVLFLITSIIFLIFGILAAIWIGKKNKGAAITLLMIGILCIILNVWITGVLWIIASIFLFRKKQQVGNDSSSSQHFNNDQQSNYNNQESNSDFLVDDAKRYTKEVKDDPYKY